MTLICEWHVSRSVTMEVRLLPEAGGRKGEEREREEEEEEEVGAAPRGRTRRSGSTRHDPARGVSMSFFGHKTSSTAVREDSQAIKDAYRFFRTQWPIFLLIAVVSLAFVLAVVISQCCTWRVEGGCSSSSSFANHSGNESAATISPDSDAITLQGVYCYWVVTILIILLGNDLFHNSGITFVFGMMLIIVPGIINIEVAVQGYGNVLLFTVACLGVVSEAIHESTAVRALFVEHFLLFWLFLLFACTVSPTKRLPVSLTKHLLYFSS